MSTISTTLSSLARAGSGAFVPYICAGDPDRRFSTGLVERLCSAGADMIEIGLPFSDPIADGPVIQKAMNRSLSAGFKVIQVFDMIDALRMRGVDKPIILMTYFNLVLKTGVERFCRELAGSGGDGILVVDLPPEESADLDKSAAANGLDVIRLVAPTTSDERMDYLLSKSSGFVYVVSSAGTTGAKDELPRSAEALLRRVVPRSPVPALLGFGISEPAHVQKALSLGAAGVVEGSKLISLYSESLHDREAALERVEEHARRMKAACGRDTALTPPE